MTADVLTPENTAALARTSPLKVSRARSLSPIWFFPGVVAIWNYRDLI